MVNQKGYSLIELIVVVGLVAFLAIGITAISMTSMLSSSRVKTLTKVRQSGDIAITEIQKLIRNAKSATCSVNTITLTNQDNNKTLITISTSKIASQSGVPVGTEYSLLPSDPILTIDSASITCTPTDNPSLIDISFSLKSQGTSTRPFETATVKFATSVQVRNQIY